MIVRTPQQRGAVSQLRNLRRSYEVSQFRHRLHSSKDYVAAPKPDGYRSMHLVYEYSNFRAPQYDGLRIELQLRTKLQHAWATSVETVDAFMDEAIKAGRPSGDWAHFFKLSSAIFSHLEKTQVLNELAGVSASSLIDMLRQSEKELNVLQGLRGFTVAANNIETRGVSTHSYHLVVLNVETRKLTITSFPLSAQLEANNAYTIVEKSAKDGLPLDPVLVTGGDVRDLRKSFPNYFLDTQLFVDRVEKVLRDYKI